MSIDLSLFCIGALSGGIKSFSIHLQRLLEMHYDCNVTMYMVKPRTEGKRRTISGNFQYMNVSADDAVAIATRLPSLIVYFANYKKSDNAEYCRKLLEIGTPLIIHDTRGLNGVDEKFLDTNLVVLSKAAQTQLPKAVLLYHPYVGYDFVREIQNNAVCMTRIDREKHTDIILEANNLLDSNNKIALCGMIDRMYEYRYLQAKYPYWKDYYIGTPEKLEMTAQDIVSKNRFAIDMSTLKNDGGRTQYSFLEAMNVGATLVINNEWLKYPGDMKHGFNCVGVGSPQELATVVSGEAWDLSEGYAKTLKYHSTIELADLYLDVMGMD